MWKKIFASAVLISAIVFGNNFCLAGNFQTIYSANSFSENLKNNEAATETFTTPYGEMKFQMRKLWNSSSENKMHLLVWLNDKQIYESYLPQIEYGYTFKAIKDATTDRQFFVVQSVERALLLGYSPENNKMEVYIDSMNYYHDFEAYNYIGTLKNGDLVLAFEQINVGNRTPRRQRYLFTWDKAANWFSYRNLGFVSTSVAQDMNN